jgi:cation-transporting ATPase 13A2
VVQKKAYDKVASTVFGNDSKAHDKFYDDDPVLHFLRFIDYRYIRFCYHPLKDKFMWNSGWKDPAWTKIKKVRDGIDGDEKDSRMILFGSNLIDIESKSIPELLVDEVSTNDLESC